MSQITHKDILTVIGFFKGLKEDSVGANMLSGFSVTYPLNRAISD